MNIVGVANMEVLAMMKEILQGPMDNHIQNHMITMMDMVIQNHRQV